jgi:hypothetical protein
MSAIIIKAKGWKPAAAADKRCFNAKAFIANIAAGGE